MLNKIFKIMRENGRILITIFGLNIKFKNPLVNQLGDCCIIPNLQRLIDNGTKFVHPIGVVIAEDVVMGKNCSIYQNVTIGKKYGTEGKSPVIGDNVSIYANACVLGDIKIGNNAMIGASAVVLNDVPENAIAAGNPAKVLKYRKQTKK